MTSQQEQDQARMTACMMGILHRIATAAGGTLAIKMDEIPEQLPFSFRIESGKGIFVALEQPPKPKSNIVPPSRRVLSMLNGR